MLRRGIVGDNRGGAPNELGGSERRETSGCVDAESGFELSDDGISRHSVGFSAYHDYLEVVANERSELRVKWPSLGAPRASGSEDGRCAM